MHHIESLRSLHLQWYVTAMFKAQAEDSPRVKGSQDMNRVKASVSLSRSQGKLNALQASIGSYPGALLQASVPLVFLDFAA